MWQFSNLRFANHIFLGLEDLQFADPIIFCGFKTSENLQIHTYHTFHKQYIFSLQICGFAILRTETPRKFADLRLADYSLQICGFADWHTSEICGLVIAEWRICRSAICKLKKKIRAHFCQYYLCLVRNTVSTLSSRYENQYSWNCRDVILRLNTSTE